MHATHGNQLRDGCLCRRGRKNNALLLLKSPCTLYCVYVCVYYHHHRRSLPPSRTPSTQSSMCESDQKLVLPWRERENKRKARETDRQVKSRDGHTLLSRRRKSDRKGLPRALQLAKTLSLRKLFCPKLLRSIKWAKPSTSKFFKLSRHKPYCGREKIRFVRLSAVKAIDYEQRHRSYTFFFQGLKKQNENNAFIRKSYFAKP